LSRIDLPKIKELIENNADDSVVLEAFESDLLARSDSYRQYLHRHSSSTVSPTYMARIRSRFVKDELIQNPQYRFIYSMLQSTDQSLDCGCGSKNTK